MEIRLKLEQWITKLIIKKKLSINSLSILKIIKRISTKHDSRSYSTGHECIPFTYYHLSLIRIITAGGIVLVVCDLTYAAICGAGSIA